MRCEIISLRSVMLILLSLVLNTVMLSQTDQTIDGMSTVSNKTNANKLDPGNANKRNPTMKTTTMHTMDEALCPSDIECSKLGGPCLNCSFNYACTYGQKINVSCEPLPSVNCTQSAGSGNKTFQRTMICRYCYQTDPWEHTCVHKANCNSVASPRAHYRTNCSVKSDILCLGRRKFFKNLPCNWTGGCRWSTALFLSITLGGFGADRFYLGHWQEGIGKLFSFGGLGVWTLIDVILISLHYLGPADGSLYI